MNNGYRKRHVARAFGLALRAARVERGISQNKLSEIVSLPVTPSFEPSAGTVGARTKVTPRRSVLD
jgi:hypothetical protein